MEISSEMKKILAVAGVLLTVVIIGYAFTRLRQQGAEPAPTPTAFLPAVTGTPEATASASPLGGDRDEFGCIGSAGFSWCEAKKKCIRVFEEDCLSAEAVRSALAQKYNKKPSEVFFDITKENTKHVVGSVSFGQKGVEGGLVMAAKINGKWTLVYDGNGSIDCVKIKRDYQFPAEMLAGICD